MTGSGERRESTTGAYRVSSASRLRKLLAASTSDSDSSSSDDEDTPVVKSTVHVTNGESRDQLGGGPKADTSVSGSAAHTPAASTPSSESGLNPLVRSESCATARPEDVARKKELGPESRRTLTFRPTDAASLSLKGPRPDSTPDEDSLDGSLTEVRPKNSKKAKKGVTIAMVDGDHHPRGDSPTGSPLCASNETADPREIAPFKAGAPAAGKGTKNQRGSVAYSSSSSGSFKAKEQGTTTPPAKSGLISSPRGSRIMTVADSIAGVIFNIKGRAPEEITKEDCDMLERLLTVSRVVFPATVFDPNSKMSLEKLNDFANVPIPTYEEMEDDDEDSSERSGSDVMSRTMSMKSSITSKALAGTCFVNEVALRSFQLSVHGEPVCVDVEVECAVMHLQVCGYGAMSNALEKQGVFMLYDVVNTYLCQLIKIVDEHKGEIVTLTGQSLTVVWNFEDSSLSACSAIHCMASVQRKCPVYAYAGCQLSVKAAIESGTIHSSVFRLPAVKSMASHFQLVAGAPLQLVQELIHDAVSGDVLVGSKARALACQAFTFQSMAQAGHNTPSASAGSATNMPTPAITAAPSTNEHAAADGTSTESPGHTRLGRRQSITIQSAASEDFVGPGEHIESPVGTHAEIGFVESPKRGSMLRLSRATMKAERLVLGSTEQPCDCQEKSLSPMLRLNYDLDEDVDLDYEHRDDNVQRFVPPPIVAQLKSGRMLSQIVETRLLTVLYIHKTDQRINIADWVEELYHVVQTFRCAIVQIIEDHSGVHVVAAANLLSVDREPAVTGLQLAKALVERRAGCTIGVSAGTSFCGLVGDEKATSHDISGPACTRAKKFMEHGVKHNMPVVIGESVVVYSGDASLASPLGEVLVEGSKEPTKVYTVATIDTTLLSAISCGNGSIDAVFANEYEELRHAMVESKAQRIACLVRGSTACGKAMLCVRTVYGTDIIPMMHYSVSDSKPLHLLATVSRWFMYHKNERVSNLAKELFAALDKEHNIQSTSIGLELINMMVVEGLQMAIVVRQVQRLDTMSLSFLRQALAASTPGKGRLIVMCTMVPQANTMPWSAISASLGTSTFNMQVGHLSDDELAALVAHRLSWECEPYLLSVIRNRTNGIAGCVDQFVTALPTLEGIGEGATVSCTGVFALPPEAVDRVLCTSWTRISRVVCAKAAQVISSLSPVSVGILKIAAVLNTPFYAIHKGLIVDSASVVVEKLKSSRYRKEIDFLMDVFLFQHSDADDDDLIEFESPAIMDVVLSAILPQEVKDIASKAIEKFSKYFMLSTPEELLSLAHLHFVAYGGASEKYKHTVHDAIRLLFSEEVEEQEGGADNAKTGGAQTVEERRTVVMNKLRLDFLNKGVEWVDVLGKGVDTLRGYVLKPEEQAEPIPPHLIELRNWHPPITLGVLTDALRELAICLCRMVTDSSKSIYTPATYLQANVQRLELYATFAEQIDRLVGFTSPMSNEAEFLCGLCTIASYGKLCRRAQQFLAYIHDTVLPRAAQVHVHIQRSLYVPYAPSYRPVFDGANRVALEDTLKVAVKLWETCKYTAIRDALMELATQGWVAKNPEQSVEAQRDIYLRKRSAEPICFVSLLYVNLSLSAV